MTLFTYTPNYELGQLFYRFKSEKKHSLPEMYTTGLREEIVTLCQENQVDLNKLYVRQTPNGFYQLYSINHPLLPDHLRFSTSREKLQKLLKIEPQTKPVFNNSLEFQLAKMQFSDLENINLKSASYSTPCQWLKAYNSNNVLSLYFTGANERIDWE